MFDVGGGELILILLGIILLFGPKKLPELARSVGKGLRHVRKAQEDLTQQIRDISADVAEPVTRVQDQVKKEFTITVDDNAVARTVEKKPADTEDNNPANKPEPPNDEQSAT